MLQKEMRKEPDVLILVILYVVLSDNRGRGLVQVLKLRHKLLAATQIEFFLAFNRHFHSAPASGMLEFGVSALA